MSNLFGTKIFLNNLSSITIANLKEWTSNIILSWTTSKISHLKISVNLCEQPYAGTMFIMSNQNIIIQNMNNQRVYYSLWAINFFLSSSLANLRCAKEGWEMQVGFHF